MERVLEIERGSTISYSVENTLWMRLWTCRKTECGMNGYLWVCSVYCSLFLSTFRKKCNNNSINFKLVNVELVNVEMVNVELVDVEFHLI
jgi:hypothetical protein